MDVGNRFLKLVAPFLAVSFRADFQNRFLPTSEGWALRGLSRRSRVQKIVARAVRQSEAIWGCRSGCLACMLMRLDFELCQL